MATVPTKQSKLREALKKEYVKTAILIMILIGSAAGFLFGVRAVLRNDDPFMTVVSGSMVPTLNIGDLVVVQGYADPSTIYAAPKNASPPGDILVCWHKTIGRLVHRAVGNVTYDGKRYLLTRGDANSGPTTDTHYNLTTGEHLPGLPEEYVIGKVVANVPYLGNVLLLLQTPIFRVILIVIIVALIVVEFVPILKKRDEKQVPEQEQVKA